MASRREVEEKDRIVRDLEGNLGLLEDRIV